MTDAPERIWAEGIAERLLHIIAQDVQHADATIYGSPEALSRLGYALIDAATSGQDQVLRDVMVKDGEGYHITICPRDEWQMNNEAPYPYAQAGLPWELEPAIRSDLHAAALAERDALREALELAHAALRGCNMNMNHIRKKVDAALSEGEKP